MATLPVQQDESVYRQASGGNPLYVDPSRPLPVVHRSLFYPSKGDTDGLSLIRKKFRTPIWAAFRVERPDVRYQLVVVAVERLRSFALDKLGIIEFMPTKDALDARFGEPWAHCVLRDINITVYNTDDSKKRGIKNLAIALEEALSMDDVTEAFPRAPQEETDPYRPTEFLSHKSGCLGWLAPAR